MSGLRFSSSDGSLPTVVINDPAVGIYRQVAYRPGDPPLRTISVENPLEDGDEVPITTYGNVTETATATLYVDGTVPSAQLVKRDLERLFSQARHFARYRRGPRIYAEWRAHEGEGWWRSIVHNGRAPLIEDALGLNYLPAGEPHIDIHFTRGPFWEGPAVAVPLSNRYGTATTIAVDNAPSGGLTNYVTINGAALDGDLPGLATLTYENATNSVARVQTVYVGLSVFSAGVSPASLALAGFAEQLPTGEVVVSNQTLSSALLSAAQGTPFRLLMRATNPLGAEIRADTYFSVTKLVEGTWTGVQDGPSELGTDIGTVYLPPHLQGFTGSMADLTLRLRIRPKGGVVTGRLGAAGLYLLPAERIRVLNALGFPIAYGARFVDNPIDKLAYSDGWSGGALGNVIATGSPMQLTPGRTNVLHVYAVEDDGDMQPGRVGNLSITYRPRRLNF